LIFAVPSVVSALSPGVSNRFLAKVWLFSGVLLVVLPVFLSRWHLSAFCFASESYVLSVALLLFALPVFFVRSLGWREVAAITALTVVLSYTKVSTALFIPGLALLRFAFLQTQRKSRDGALLILSGTVVLLFLFAVVKTGESGGMHGFGLSRMLETIPLGVNWTALAKAWRASQALTLDVVFLAGAALLFYAAFHFIISWCVLWLAARHSDYAGPLRNPLFLYVAGSTLAGLVLSCSYYDDNNIGTYYFSHPAFLLALPFFSAWLSGCGWWGLRAETLAILSGLLVSGVSAQSYYKYSRWAPLRERNEKCASVARELRKLRYSAPLDVTLRAAPDVAELPLVKSRSTEPRLKPTSQPFLFPAVSERPWTGVTGHRGTNRSENYITYGYLGYDMDRETGQMRSEPVLLEGMSIKEWEGAAIPR
jgi:hypothetical protein